MQPLKERKLVCKGFLSAMMVILGWNNWNTIIKKKIKREKSLAFILTINSLSAKSTPKLKIAVQII